MILLGILLEIFGLIKLYSYITNIDELIQISEMRNEKYTYFLISLLIIDSIISIAGGICILYNNM